MAPSPASAFDPTKLDVFFEQYVDEDTQLPLIASIIDRELSEPYSIFTYRYFLNNWPELPGNA